MKIFILPFLLLLLSHICFAQPQCLEKKSYTNFQLAKKPLLYRVIIKSRPNCRDCSQGVTYLDSTCQQVAAFTIGFATTAYVKDGYNINDFPEGKDPRFYNAYKRSENRISYFFDKPVSFEITEIVDTSFHLFSAKDSLVISNASGLQLYRQARLVENYKIIPGRIELQQNGSNRKITVYYMDALKRYVYLKDFNSHTEFYVSKLPLEEGKLPTVYADADWKIYLRVQKK